MKKQLLTLAICLSTISSFAANLYVNGSGLPNTYLTLQDAIDAASDGDYIYMDVSTQNYGPANVNKSVYIISSVSGEKFQFVGDIIIGDNIEQVTIIGANGMNIKTQGYASSKTNVNIISSILQSLDISHENYKLNIYDCDVGSTAYIRNGVIKGSKFETLSILNESTVEVDTIKIIANEFSQFSYANSKHNFEIYNNFFYNNSNISVGMQFQLVPDDINAFGIIANNSILFGGWSGSTWISDINANSPDYAGLYFNTTPNNFSSLMIINNYIEDSYYGYAIQINNTFPGTYIANNFYDCWRFGPSSDYHFMIDNTGQNLSMNQSGNINNSGTDLGIDQPMYYDIDGSRNDIGNSGGPHAWSQYHTSGGKAVIFDLEIPSQIYLGTSQSIKAKGVHKN